MSLLAPTVEQVEKRLGQSPDQWLVDGGFSAREQIDAVVGKTEVYAPVPEPRQKKDEQGNAVQPDGSQDKHQPKPGDSETVASWRVRMGRQEAQELYKQRAATAECVNAQSRNRGLLQMPVRGLPKVRCLVGLFVLAPHVDGIVSALGLLGASVGYRMTLALRAQAGQNDAVMSPISPSTRNVRGAVATTSLALAMFATTAFSSGESAPAAKSGAPATAAAPARHASASVSVPYAATPRPASPPGRAASSTPGEAADARAKRLQRLHIESCRRRPQTCVQPQSDAHAASAPAIAR